MRKTFILLAGAAGVALAGGLASAQTYSWGNKETTYFYSPSTTLNYSPTGPVTPGARQAAPEPDRNVPPSDPMFYRAPDSYGVYRQPPRAGADTNPAMGIETGDENLGQGSGMDDAVGRE